jgi:hypothetical protein
LYEDGLINTVLVFKKIERLSVKEMEAIEWINW